ncbi:hypothetical protein EYF80_017387 [Liparis tanakae]|uniref:Uncharacterized protein n=1 Tax=Liparis tanakae TaxID=230148 RepID=A0A4Z2I339_9TELE|nr:hypothetical protein EYF80_017387 [Liparis tanakae]
MAWYRLNRPCSWRPVVGVKIGLLMQSGLWTHPIRAERQPHALQLATWLAEAEVVLLRLWDDEVELDLFPKQQISTSISRISIRDRIPRKCRYAPVLPTCAWEESHRHVWQERRTSWKPTAVTGCDDVIEGSGEEHRGRATHSPRPGAALMRRGGARRQGARGGGFGVLPTRLGGGVRLSWGVGCLRLSEGLGLRKYLRVTSRPGVVRRSRLCSHKISGQSQLLFQSGSLKDQDAGQGLQLQDDLKTLLQTELPPHSGQPSVGPFGQSQRGDPQQHHVTVVGGALLGSKLKNGLLKRDLGGRDQDEEADPVEGAKVQVLCAGVGDGTNVGQQLSGHRQLNGTNLTPLYGVL